MGTRPQTLYGLADSPINLAAFMLDHGDESGQPGLVQQILEERDVGAIGATHGNRRRVRG
jgi:hypothetical protein